MNLGVGSLLKSWKEIRQRKWIGLLINLWNCVLRLRNYY